MNEPWDSGPIDPRMGISCNHVETRTFGKEAMFPISKDDMDRVKHEVLTGLMSGPKPVSDVVGWVFGRLRFEASASSAWTLYYNLTQRALRELSVEGWIKSVRMDGRSLWSMA